MSEQIYEATTIDYASLEGRMNSHMVADALKGKDGLLWVVGVDKESDPNRHRIIGQLVRSAIRQGFLKQPAKAISFTSRWADEGTCVEVFWKFA